LAGQRNGREQVLARIDALVDWPAIATLLAALDPSRHGAPGYPALMMFKALLLQQWYRLSDPGLEEALADRISFRRFAGLSLSDGTPDHSTLCRFRQALGAAGLSAPVFAAITRQIDAKGLILREGTLIDASLVEAQVKRPRKPAEAAPDAATPTAAAPAADVGAASEGKAPTPARPPSKLIANPLDPEASWAKKGGRRYFGYKAHVGVDLGSNIIRRVRLTTAAVADTTMGDELIVGDERAVYADKAYDTKARRQQLKARGAKDRISHRPNKHHALMPWQEKRNEGIAHRRSAVERVFAIAKCLMGWRRVRYRGLRRNATHFDILCTAINLKRWAALTP
jgi:IS5 family transposase